MAAPHSADAPVSQHYDAMAVSLHWLVFVLITGGFSLGLYMVDLPVSPAKLKYYSWHKWTGVTVFLLAIARLAWRITHPPPPAVPGPSWQQRTAHLTHWLLYALIILTPISGWLYSSATGFKTVYFGVIPLPDLIGKAPALKAPLKLVHLSLNYTMAALVGLHVLAVIKHALIDRDATLRRMLPGRAGRR